MKQQPTIHSSYNTREAFSFDQTPNEFRSVTEKSINKIKKHCAEIISNKYDGNYDARALYAMVKTVIGNFDLLSSKLKDDYSCRRSKLKTAQNIGIRKTNKSIFEFEKTVADREMALKRYSDNVFDYDGYVIDEGLSYPKERIEIFRKRLVNIEEKNHEA